MDTDVYKTVIKKDKVYNKHRRGGALGPPAKEKGQSVKILLLGLSTRRGRRPLQANRIFTDSPFLMLSKSSHNLHSTIYKFLLTKKSLYGILKKIAGRTDIMKKILCLILSLLIVLSVTVPVMADDEIKVKIDGEQITFDVAPQIINDRTMVPLRAIFEALGATVDWNGETRTVTSTRNDTTISLTIDSATMTVNGEDRALDSPACLINDRTLVPVRAISEAFGTTVDWIGEERTVLITTDGIVEPIVCTWADNKTAAVSVTIDDGVYDSAIIYNDLQKKYGIRSTQFIITKGLNDEFGSKNLYYVDGWNEIFKQGYMDVGNHSYSHAIKYSTDTYTEEELAHDIITSQEELKEVFADHDVISFATPWGQNPQNVITELKKSHYANRGAGGGVISNGKKISNMYKLPSVTVQFGTPLEDLNGYVDEVVSTGGWYIPLLHGIGADTSSAESYASNINTIEEHFKYIKEKSDAGDVWSGSFNDVVKYIYERNSAKVEVVSSAEDSITINVTDTMEDNEIFDYPLTIKVNVPKEWSEKAQITQGKTTKDVKVVDEDGKKFVYVNVIPDGGEAVIIVK